MRWRERLGPVSMCRVALLVPTAAARDLLVHVADAGAVQIATTASPDRVNGPAAALMRRLIPASTAPQLLRHSPDLAWCEQHDRLDLVAGEAELERVLAAGVPHGSVMGFVGWAPADRVELLAAQVAPVGGAVVRLRHPAGTQPPTLLSPGATGRAFAPLVETYATPPYHDVDSSALAGLAYIVMFGMMFADLGHGALVLTGALIIRFGHVRRLERLRTMWMLLAGAGASSMLFGALYGEFFGPTHTFPVVWLAPLDRPVPLLLAAIGIGAGLLAGAYVLGSVNRFREGGWRRAVYASSGIAGAGVFAALGFITAGIYWQQSLVTIGGVSLLAIFVVVAATGFFTESGGGASGAAQTSVELLDLVVRLGSNVVSFARLAAFGMTHAALGQVVWQSTVGLTHHHALGIVGAIVVFAIGNAITFSLEALIAGVQALRLEYYELFSRVFVTAGEPFRPWQLPIDPDTSIPSSSVEA